MLLRGFESNEKKNSKLGMVVHTCNPSNWEAKRGSHEMEASLGYIAKPCLKKKKKKLTFSVKLQEKIISRNLSIRTSKYGPCKYLVLMPE
jgi:hypothetical protein